MKITKQSIREMIKEEVSKSIDEGLGASITIKGLQFGGIISALVRIKRSAQDSNVSAEADKIHDMLLKMSRENP